MDGPAQGRLEGIADLGDRRLLVRMEALGAPATALRREGGAVVAAGGAGPLLELAHRPLLVDRVPGEAASVGVIGSGEERAAVAFAQLTGLDGLERLVGEVE